MSRLSLWKRSGVYYVGYRQNGKRCWKSTSCRTKPEALKAISDLKKLLEQKQRGALLSEFVREFLAYSEANHAVKTFRLYRQVLATFLDFCGDIPINTVAASHVDKYKLERLKFVKPVSVNVELRHLKSAFSVALRWRHITENPCKGVPMVRLPQASPPFLTPAEFSELLKAIPEAWFRELITFAVNTGLRQGEILNLRRSDVDFERKVAIIESSPSFKTNLGAGHEGGGQLVEKLDMCKKSPGGVS